MSKPIHLMDYIIITKHLCSFAPKRGLPPAPFVAMMVDSVTGALDRCQLPMTCGHGEALRHYRRRIIKQNKAKATECNLEELAAIADSLLDSLSKEAKNKEVLLLAATTASRRLKRLSKTTPVTSIQRHLVAETVRCLECGSWRAAVVMGWNLVYDYVRHWAWKNTKRRACFNKTLKVRHTTKTGSPVYPKGIRKYDDFFCVKPALSEWAVLETMRDAGLLSVPIHDKLCHYLRERNNFAHPSFRKPSEHKASAYIEDLLDLIADHPFAGSASTR